MRQLYLLIVILLYLQSCDNEPQATTQELRAKDSLQRIDSLKALITIEKLNSYKMETFIVNQIGQMFMADYQDVWIIKDGLMPTSYCFIDLYRKDIRNGVYALIQTNRSEESKMNLFITKTEYNITDNGTEVYYYCEDFDGLETLLTEYITPSKTGNPSKSYTLDSDYDSKRRLYMSRLAFL